VETGAGRDVAGKSSAVADVAAQAGPDQGRSVAHTPAPAEAGAQADLLGFEAELSLFEGDTIRPPKRGPGRPPGSVSRTTLQLQRLLMAKGYRDPAEFLAAIVSMDARDLARELSEPMKVGDVTVLATSLGAAVELQVKAAKELMPYFHQKMPIAVEHTGDGARPLIIIRDGETVRIQQTVDGRAMSIHDVEEVQQDQALSASGPAGSHGSRSHGGANDE
jgi:hypothetical protein